MRVVVFSDTHGNINRAVDAVLLLKEVDMIIHLGDTVSDAKELAYIFPDIKMHMVCGNNDYCATEPTLKKIQADGYTFLITHGHRHGVKNSLYSFATAVRESGADMGLFGHTHKSFDGYCENVHLVNPGSAKGNYLGEATCAVIETENGKLKSMIWQIP